MKAGVRLKLFAISLTLVVGVGLVSGIYLEQQLRRWLAARLEVAASSKRASRDVAAQFFKK